jgi:hypothetical protein
MPKIIYYYILWYVFIHISKYKNFRKNTWGVLLVYIATVHGADVAAADAVQ